MPELGGGGCPAENKDHLKFELKLGLYRDISSSIADFFLNLFGSIGMMFVH